MTLTPLTVTRHISLNDLHLAPPSNTANTANTVCGDKRCYRDKWRIMMTQKLFSQGRWTFLT